jgi:hypothetical protein
MDYVIRDARKNNPGIKILVTLEFGNGELGGGMARVRKFDPSLTGVDYVAKCLSGPDGGDLYELDKFGLKSCELTLSKALLINAKRACDKRRR